MDRLSPDVGQHVVRDYLSRQDFKDLENSCPLVALPTDVSRSSESVKRAFETGFEGMVSILERSSIKNGHSRRTTAQGIAALCVAGMVVARAMLNRRLADELWDASMAVALQVGGWDEESKNGILSDRNRML